jgi:hypothetical protein
MSMETRKIEVEGKINRRNAEKIGGEVLEGGEENAEG